MPRAGALPTLWLAASHERASALCRDVRVDEAEYLLPGVGRFAGKLRILAIKEAVRRILVNDNRVFDARRVQLLVKLLHVADRNALVGPAKESQRRIANLRRAVQNGARAAKVAAHPGVKADDSGKAQRCVHAGGEGKRAAHAEAHGEGCLSG